MRSVPLLKHTVSSTNGREPAFPDAPTARNASAILCAKGVREVRMLADERPGSGVAKGASMDFPLGDPEAGPSAQEAYWRVLLRAASRMASIEYCPGPLT